MDFNASSPPSCSTLSWGYSVSCFSLLVAEKFQTCVAVVYISGGEGLELSEMTYPGCYVLFNISVLANLISDNCCPDES
jgi:hypothetical protein